MNGEISNNLPDRFIRLHPNSKKPIGNEWQLSPLLSRSEINNHLKGGGNVGFRFGDSYIGFDCDSVELELAIEQLISKPTYIQRSAKRKLPHFFFKAKGFDPEKEIGKKLGLEHNKKSVGEFFCMSNTQFVIAPSIIDGEEYEVVTDFAIAEITKQELMSVLLQFNSQLTKPALEETKILESAGDVDSLSITSIVNLAGLKQNSKGQYHGSNPWHGSTTGDNFYVDPGKNLAYCFHGSCDCAISPIKAVALNEGLIGRCSDSLRGDTFLKARGVATQKYGLQKQTYDQAQYNNQFKEPEQKNVKVEVICADDAVKRNTKVPYLIQDLIAEGDNILSGGLSGSLKTLGRMNQAICISKGLKYLGKFKTRQKNVLMILAETNPLFNSLMLKAMRKGLGVRKTPNLWLIERKSCGDLMQSGFRNEVLRIVREKNIGYLLLDTINPLTPEINDNAAQEVVRIFKRVLFPFQEAGLTTEYLMHTDKKGVDILGSIKWRANSENVFFFERNGLNPDVVVSNLKNRLGECPNQHLHFDFIKPNNQLKEIKVRLDKVEGFGRVAKKKSTQSDKARTEIINLLGKQTLTYTELVKIVNQNTKVSDRTIKNVIEGLTGNVIDNTVEGYKLK